MLSFDLSARKVESLLSDTSSRWLDLPGVRVHYRIKGSGPSVLLLHNSGMWGGIWDDWLKGLSKTHTVVVPDLPGCGLTGPSQSGDYSMEGLTLFVAQFLHTIKEEPVHVVGLSLGGQLAWRLALSQPDIVKSLILINPTGYPEKKPPMVFKLARGRFGWFLRVMGSTKLLRKNLEALWGDGAPVSDAFLERLLTSQRRKGNRAAFLKFLRTDNESLHTEIPKISKPVQIQWSDMCGPEQFSADIPNAERVGLGGLGHIPVLEAPEATLEAARNFLSLQE